MECGHQFDVRGVEEFFFAGGASAYTVDGDMTMDGKWNLKESARAAFKSRMLVRRPLDEQRFNGTVVVEWLNVSGGADGAPGFMYNSDLIVREGFAYVDVSAQQVGMEGGGFSLGGSGAVPLKQFDPERHGSLSHPGDSYSFDIFSADVTRAHGSSTVKGIRAAIGCSMRDRSIGFRQRERCEGASDRWLSLGERPRSVRARGR